ncbi:MAG: hypothetical protein QJR01_04375 [Kyrpidia sp.]|nr:hypothetical protein [Kyrpidia sp.]
MSDDLTRKLERMAEDARQTLFRGWGISEDLMKQTLARADETYRRRSRFASRWILGVASLLLALAGAGAVGIRIGVHPAVTPGAQVNAGVFGAQHADRRAGVFQPPFSPPQPEWLIAGPLRPIAGELVSQSPVPVVLPEAVPAPAVTHSLLRGAPTPGGRMAVIHQILADGYRVEMGWQADGEPDSGPISEGNRVVSISGTLRDAPPPSFLDTVRNRIASADPVTLDGGFPAKRLVLRDTGGDVVTWSAGGWTYLTAGLFRSGPEDVSVSEATALVQDLAAGSPVAPGAARGRIQMLDLGNRPTAEVVWTYDGKTWYSVQGSSLPTVLTVARTMHAVSSPDMREDIPFQVEWRDSGWRPGASASPHVPVTARVSRGIGADRAWLQSQGIRPGAWTQADHTGSRVYLAGGHVVKVAFDQGTVVVTVSGNPAGVGAESVIWSGYVEPVTKRVRIVDEAGKVLYEASGL